MNGQKELDIEIVGSKKEPSCFEIINFDKTKNNEFYEQIIEYIKEALVLISLNLELKEEEDLSTIKIIYKFKIFVNKLSNQLFNFRTLFRKRWKKVSFDIIQNNENIKNEFETNNDSANNNLNIGIKTCINLKDIFSEKSRSF